MRRFSMMVYIGLLMFPLFALAQTPNNSDDRQAEYKSDYRRTDRDCPPSLFDIWGAGKRLYDQGEYRLAIVAFKDVIFMDPSFIEAYEYKGHALFWLRDYEGALLDFNEVIRFYEAKMESEPRQGNDVPHDLQLITHTHYDDKLEQILNNRGTSYFEIGEYASAYLDFKAALGYNPTSQEARHNLDLAIKMLKSRNIPIPGTQPKDRLIDRIFTSKKEFENVEGSSTCEYLVVNKVELTRNSTLLFFQIVNPPDGTEDIFINAKSNSKDAFFLLGEQNSKYKLKKGYDQLTEEPFKSLAIGPGEEQSIVLEFERIPEDFKLLHLIEGNVDQMYACNIYDIQLK